MTHYFYNIVLYHGCYFYIMCFYLNIKLRRNLLNIYKTKIKFQRKVYKYIKTLHSIHIEIQEYNQYFWSKYLFILWLFMGSICLIYLYLCIFKTLDLLHKFVFIYSFCIFTSFFIIQIMTASSVNSRVKSCYKILNSKMSSNSNQRNKRLFTRITFDLKVYCF